MEGRQGAGGSGGRGQGVRQTCLAVAGVRRQGQASFPEREGEEEATGSGDVMTPFSPMSHLLILLIPPSCLPGSGNRECWEEQGRTGRLELGWWREDSTDLEWGGGGLGSGRWQWLSSCQWLCIFPRHEAACPIAPTSSVGCLFLPLPTLTYDSVCNL